MSILISTRLSEEIVAALVYHAKSKDLTLYALSQRILCDFVANNTAVVPWTSRKAAIEYLEQNGFVKKQSASSVPEDVEMQKITLTEDDRKFLLGGMIKSTESA